MLFLSSLISSWVSADFPCYSLGYPLVFHIFSWGALRFILAFMRSAFRGVPWLDLGIPLFSSGFSAVFLGPRVDVCPKPFLQTLSSGYRFPLGSAAGVSRPASRGGLSKLPPLSQLKYQNVDISGTKRATKNLRIPN